MTGTTETITREELAGALARREPGMSREDAARLSRTLLADAIAHREPAPAPLVMPADEFAAVGQVRELVSAAIEKAWWSQGGPASEAVMGVIWPLLEARSGVVLDGMLITSLGERADSAEVKLAAIEAYCRTRPELAGAGFPRMAADILAIIGGACACGQEDCRG